MVGGLSEGSLCVRARSAAVLWYTPPSSPSSFSMASSEVGDHADDEWKLGVGAVAGAVDGVDWWVRVDAADAAETGVSAGSA